MSFFILLWFWPVDLARRGSSGAAGQGRLCYPDNALMRFLLEHPPSIRASKAS